MKSNRQLPAPARLVERPADRAAGPVYGIVASTPIIFRFNLHRRSMLAWHALEPARRLPTGSGPGSLFLRSACPSGLVGACAGSPNCSRDELPPRPRFRRGGTKTCQLGPCPTSTRPTQADHPLAHLQGSIAFLQVMAMLAYRVLIKSGCVQAAPCWRTGPALP